MPQPSSFTVKTPRINLILERECSCVVQRTRNLDERLVDCLVLLRELLSNLIMKIMFDTKKSPVLYLIALSKPKAVIIAKTNLSKFCIISDEIWVFGRFSKFCSVLNILLVIFLPFFRFFLAFFGQHQKKYLCIIILKSITQVAFLCSQKFREVPSILDVLLS